MGRCHFHNPLPRVPWALHFEGINSFMAPLLRPSGAADLSLVPNLAYDIQKLYDKDHLGNVIIDKKRLEKILLLSYVCNTQAGGPWG